MIFQCAEPNCTDTIEEKTNAVGGTAYRPTSYSDNTYVGYYYGTAHTEEKPSPSYEETHSNTTPSTIAEAVNNWYTGKGAMTNYTDYLDGSTGFCNDRTIVKDIMTGDNGDGTGQKASGYAPSARLFAKSTWRTKQYPTLKCGVVMPDTNPTDAERFSSFDEIDPIALKRDLYTIEESNRGNAKLSVSAALITSDEYVMAGGFAGAVSTNYWLYTNQTYWTMSPCDYFVDGWARVFNVWDNGLFSAAGVQDTRFGVRPVINLKADIEFTSGTGASSNPFIVKPNN